MFYPILMYFKVNGDEGSRTPDLSVANASLSHLSYIPKILLYLNIIKDLFQ